MASQGCGKNCVIDPAPSDRENALLAAQCGVCMPCASLSTEEAAFSPRKYLDSRLKILCRPEPLWVRTNPSDSELAADETDKVLVTGSDEADSDLVIAEKGAECTCSGAMEGAGGSVGSTALDVEQLDEEDVRLTNPDTADASCETVVDLALISISFSRQAAARAVGRCSASVFHPSLMTLARAEFRIKCVDGRRLTRDANSATRRPSRSWKGGEPHDMKNKTMEPLYTSTGNEYSLHIVTSGAMNLYEPVTPVIGGHASSPHVEPMSLHRP